MKIRLSDIANYDASDVTYYASEQDAQRIAAVICWDNGDDEARLFQHTFPLGGNFWAGDYCRNWDNVIVACHRPIDAEGARLVFDSLNLEGVTHRIRRWEIEAQIERDLGACPWIRIYVDSYDLVDDSALVEGLDLNECAREVSEGDGYYVTSRAQQCYEYRLANKE